MIATIKTRIDPGESCLICHDDTRRLYIVVHEGRVYNALCMDCMRDKKRLAEAIEKELGAKLKMDEYDYELRDKTKVR